MLKRKELATTTSCLNKASHDEFIFVLRAKDELAPQTIRLWAAMAQGVHEKAKIDEALALADSMEKQRYEKWPPPPGVADVGTMIQP